MVYKYCVYIFQAKLEVELSTIKKQFFQLKSKQDFGEQQEAEMNAELQSLKRQLKAFKESQDKADSSSSGEFTDFS